MKEAPERVTCEDPEVMFALGERIGERLSAGHTVLLQGGLGAGKTLLTKGIVSFFGFDEAEVTSPSFTLVNLYRTEQIDVYHIDLWRIDDNTGDVAGAVGLSEILEESNAITVIEWSEKLRGIELPDAVLIRIEGDGDAPRSVEIHWPSTDDTRIKTAESSLLAEPVLVVYKSSRSLELFDGERLIKRYAIALGSEPDGDKEVEGDGRTPEGDFYVFAKNPESRFHLSLGISYPGKDAAERGLQTGATTEAEYREIVAALAEGRMPLQKTKLGGEIYIHGGGTEKDWTEGCVALDNEDITELFDLIPLGTRVRVLP